MVSKVWRKAAYYVKQLACISTWTEQFRTFDMWAPGSGDWATTLYEILEQCNEKQFRNVFRVCTYESEWTWERTWIYELAKKKNHTHNAEKKTHTHTPTIIKITSFGISFCSRQKSLPRWTLVLEIFVIITSHQNLSKVSLITHTMSTSYQSLAGVSTQCWWG